jgi:hypothetical protein
VLRRKAGSPSFEEEQTDLTVAGGLSSTAAAAVTGGTGRRGQADDGDDDDPGDLPSTSSSSAMRQLESGGLMERHRKAKARAEKEEKRRRDRLDFDFPSETARKEKRRAEKDGSGSGLVGPLPGAAGGIDVGFGTLGSDGASMWTSGGHLNLFADLERVRLPYPILH